MAAGYDGSIRIDTKVNTDGFNHGVSSMSGGLVKLRGGLKAVGAAAASAFLPLTIAAATLEVIKFGKAGVQASSDLKNAMSGMQSIVDGQGRSFKQAKAFVDEYVSDGLIPMTDAATAYKNLASRGYSDSQIEQTLTALKDASAYGRQSSLSIGEAVKSASEGLKNENSILVDNAGVTKNVAKMWDDYAKSIGTTANNLTQQQKIQAEVNGIMQETRYQTGDAAEVAGSFSGQLAQLSFHFNEMKVALGDGLIPLLKALLPIIDAAVQGLTWIFRKLANVIQLITGQTADMEQSASDAASAENDLADGVNNASKAAKKALANFDDLNILQLGLSDGGGASGVTGGLADSSLVDALGKGRDAFSDFSARGVIPAKNNVDNFKTSLEAVKVLAAEPIKVSSPAVEKMPDPVWQPNWGLNVPDVSLPRIPMFPTPVWRPNWGLDIPAIQLPAFPTIPTPVYSPVWGFATSLVPEFGLVNAALSAQMPAFEAFAMAYASSIMTLPANTSIATVAAQTILSSFSLSSSQIMSDWGVNIMSNTRTTLQYLVDATVSALTSVGRSYGEYAVQTSQINAELGNNLAQNTGSAFQSMVSTAGGALQNIWSSFASLASAVGAEVSEWWGDNKSWAAPAAALALAGIAVGTVVITGGVSLPAAASLGSAAMAALPALAEGAVIPPNKQFAAILGDQTHGTNIETPLATMIGAFTAALDARGGAAGGEVTLRVVAGDRFIRDVKFEIDRQSNLSGVKLVRGGAVV